MKSMRCSLKSWRPRIPDRRPAHGLFCAAVIALFPALPGESLAAQETSMMFVESPTLLATFVRTPRDYDPARHRSIVVALHGFGSSAERFLDLAEPFTSAGVIFAAVRAPYTFMYEGGQVGYDWSLQHLRQRGPGDRAAELTLDYIAAVTAALRERYQAERVFLMGFSQGGAFAYMSAVANHASVDGLIIFGAGFDETWFPDGSLSEARHLPVFIAHGETDEAVSISAAERARDTLRGIGFDVTYRPFAAGHSVPLDVLTEVAGWMGR